jgi:hypothetical protein
MIVGGTSVTYNIEERSATNSAGTNALATDQTANDVAASIDSTAFDNAGFAADSYVYIDISAVVGVVTAFTCTISATVA